MNIIVHYPMSDEAKKELQNKVSQLHSEVVNSYISSLSCPIKQKKELMKAVISIISKS